MEHFRFLENIENIIFLIFSKHDIFSNPGLIAASAVFTLQDSAGAKKIMVKNHQLNNVQQ